MAKKKTGDNVARGGAPAKNPANTQRQQPVRKENKAADSESFLNKYSNILIPCAIGVVTFLFLATCMDNKLTNWDDLGYILSNQLIKDTSPNWLSNLFSTDAHVMGNYHPITMLTYALEYHQYGLEPSVYHRDSILLHVLCTIAVFYFIKALSGKTVVAAIVALMFGVHPMHVESVAWAAGRKDILYGLFFVMAMTCYIFYLRSQGSKKIGWYAAIVVLFALSLLSKAVAVTLPITLFVIDYFEKRPLISQGEGGKKINFWLGIDKLPLLGMAYLFGTLATDAQKKVGAYASLDATFTFMERIALSSYAFVMYLWKLIIPTGLSNFYPYPLKIADAMPGIYYIYPVIVLALAAVVYLFARKNRVVIFGIGFFIINIALLLQFVPVGGAILSDRYGYIPYIGLWFIMAWFINNYYEKQGMSKVVLGGTLAYCLVLGFVANARCKDWHDSITLWKDDIEKHPEGPVGYFYLGQEYYTQYEEEANPNRKKVLGDSSLMMFNMSIQRKPDYINPIICIAELQRNYGQINEAKQTYYKAIKINAKNESVYSGLGVVYAILHQYDSAEYAFRTSLQLKYFSPEAHSNFANFFDIIGKTDSSLKEYAIAIQQNPDAYIPYMNRARIYMRKNDFDNAIKDLNIAAAKSEETGEIYYLRAKCYFSKGNKAQAVNDVKDAQSKGFTQIDPAFVQQLK